MTTFFKPASTRRFVDESLGFLNRRSRVRLTPGPPTLQEAPQLHAAVGGQPDATVENLGSRVIHDKFLTKQDGLDAARGILISLCIAGPFWASFVWWWIRGGQ